MAGTLAATAPATVPGPAPAPERALELVSPVAGLVGRVVPLPRPPGDPAFQVNIATLGDLTQVLPGVRLASGGRSTAGEIDGAGGSLDPDKLRWLCVVEALERYSSVVYDERQFVWARACDLGDDALDLDRVPRCSSAELAHPACPIEAPRKDVPMRWVKGLSLLSGREVWVPAVMVYLHIPFLARGERCHLPISTGCAAHTSYAGAVLNGLCEVIERDAIALTWLQMPSLPRLRLDTVPDALAPYLERGRSDNVFTHFFDATTDLGVPTVYSVEVTPHHQSVRTVVMCATSLSPADAVAKVFRETASGRVALQVRAEGTGTKSDPDTFIDVFDGAVYTGHPSRAAAFDFLLGGTRSRAFSEMPDLATGTVEGDLDVVLGVLARRGMEAIAVDLTTDEAERVGFKVVRTIVPDLQPLSFAYRAQYKGHPRLYQATPLYGHPSRPEPELNPYPQPFA